MQVPDILNELIAQNYKGYFGSANTTRAVASRTERFINPAARYFDEGVAFVPHITSERLYKKTQWVEWLLTKVQERISELPYLVQPLLSMFITKRLSMTTHRLNEYAVAQGVLRVPVDQLEALWRKATSDKDKT